MGKSRALQFVEFDGGCMIPITHRLNHDGYFRKRLKSSRDGGHHVMMHRAIFEELNGPIPDGNEIDHQCSNRGCCNPNHMRPLSRDVHLRLTNRNRYAERLLEAELYWKTTGCSGVALADKFGVSFSTGCKWIRDWTTD